MTAIGGSRPLSGRTVLVTGGTGGIVRVGTGVMGRGPAQGGAARGARVANPARDRQRAVAAADAIGTAGTVPVEIFVADLSSQSEVRRLAEEVLDRLERIDVLVNNVGGYWNSRHVTADGLERTFAVNHLAPFLLTSLLLDRLREAAAGRVVTVSSHAHTTGRIDFADLHGEHAYSGARAYNQSKLANLLFTYELARRLRGTTVTANALHPGVVSTSFGAEDPGRAQRLAVPLLRPFMKSPRQGAATSIHLASAGGLEGVTGSYFVRSRPRQSSASSYDESVAADLWRVSTGLVAGR